MASEPWSAAPSLTSRSLTSRVLVDTGPLVAYLDRRDQHHDWALEQLSQIEPPLRTCEAVLSEVCFLVRRSTSGVRAVFELLERGLLTVPFRLEEEAERVQGIMNRYSKLPASLADASLVRMAEIYQGSRVLTLDSDFRIYRIHGRKVVPVLMPDA